MTQKYNEIYQKSIENREDFWREISNDIFWYKKPTKILNSDNPPFFKWFEDGITNTCYNALDLHVDQGKGEKLAIIYDSPITCLLYTSPSPRDMSASRMPSSA